MRSSIYPVNSQIGSRNWDLDTHFREKAPFTFTVWCGSRVIASGLTWPEVVSHGYNDYYKYDVMREK